MEGFFANWGEFFLLVGSAAAVLIGLIFVVISLMQDRSRSTVLAGSKLYMGPIVLCVSFVLVLSAAALAPGVEARQFAGITAVIAAWGLWRGIASIIGITELKGEDAPYWSDEWFYGVAPSAIYLAFGAVAIACWLGLAWARDALAVAITAALLLAIRNEWDLITWIAPRHDSGKEFSGD